MRIRLRTMFLFVTALIIFLAAVGWPKSEGSFWQGRGFLIEYVVHIDTDGYFLFSAKTVNYDKFIP